MLLDVQKLVTTQYVVWIPHLLPALIILRRLRVNEKGRESVVEVNQNAALYGLQFLSNQIAHNHCFEFIFILCVYFFFFCFESESIVFLFNDSIGFSMNFAPIVKNSIGCLMKCLATVNQSSKSADI